MIGKVYRARKNHNELVRIECIDEQRGSIGFSMVGFGGVFWLTPCDFTEFFEEIEK